jgi:hypothetical protein
LRGASLGFFVVRFSGALERRGAAAALTLALEEVVLPTGYTPPLLRIAVGASF